MPHLTAHGEHPATRAALARVTTMRAELIGHLKACMTEIYLHIDARVADYIRRHLAELRARLTGVLIRSLCTRASPGPLGVCGMPRPPTGDIS